MILVGVFPLALLGLALAKSQSEEILGMNGLFFGALIILAGFAMYGVTSRFRRRTTGAPPEFSESETA